MMYQNQDHNRKQKRSGNPSGKPEIGMKKAVTLQDIADRIGCSRNTVSLALRNSPRISYLMRQRIHQVSEEFGYVPNYAAQALSLSRSGFIGVYAKSLTETVRARLADSMVSTLHSHQYKPVLGLDSHYEGPWERSSWMQTFRALKVEAILVIAQEFGKVPHWHTTIPTIFVGCQPDPLLHCDYIGLDRRNAAEVAVEHLLKRGRRKILVATGMETDFYQGARDALKKANLSPSPFPIENLLKDENDLEPLLAHLAGHREEVDAVLFYDSPLAAIFIYRILQKGFSVPGDLAVVGYDIFPDAHLLKVPLTTVEQPIEQMVDRAMHIIEQRLELAETDLIQEVLPHRLVVREST